MAENFFTRVRDYFFTDSAAIDDEETFDAADEEDSFQDLDEPIQDSRRGRGKVVPMSNPATNLSAVPSSNMNLKMIVFKPISYEDSQAIVDNLRARKPVIVNMMDLERECAQRVLDFMAGAVYALNGTIRKISYGIFVIVPSNVSLVGNGEDDTKDILSK